MIIMRFLEDLGQKLQENLINNKKLKLSKFEYKVRCMIIKPEKYSITDAENGVKMDTTEKIKNDIDNSFAINNIEKISTKDVENKAEMTETKILITNPENNSEKIIIKKISKSALYYCMFMQIYLPFALCSLLIKEKEFSEDSLFAKMLWIIVSPLFVPMAPVVLAVNYAKDHIEPQEIEDYMKLTSTAFISIMSISMILYLTINLWRCKHYVLVVCLLVLSGGLGYEFALWYSYYIGLIVGLAICLIQLQLIWFFLPWRISFEYITQYTIFEEYLFYFVNCFLMYYYPNLDIFLAILTHISVLYSIGWLMIHIQLFRKFGETHLYGSVAFYSNIFLLTVKLLLALHFYK